MNAESTYFLTAGCTALTLALPITRFWWRNRHLGGVGYWALATWLFAATDFLFVASAFVHVPWVRFASRTLVTATYGVLLLGAQATAGRKPAVGLVLAGIAGYGAALLFIFDAPGTGLLRHVFSRSIWAALCLLSYRSLRSSRNHFCSALVSPAGIFLLQATYLLARLVVYTALTRLGYHAEPALLTYIDYVNAVMFDGALFVSLLVALIENRNAELAASRVELQTLTGLLPVCAWCKKVRDDAGYWHEVTEYIARTNVGKVTHGLCQACSTVMASTPPPGDGPRT